jgi:hypothetical protein
VILKVLIGQATRQALQRYAQVALRPCSRLMSCDLFFLRQVTRSPRALIDWQAACAPVLEVFAAPRARTHAHLGHGAHITRSQMCACTPANKALQRWAHRGRAGCSSAPAPRCKGVRPDASQGGNYVGRMLPVATLSASKTKGDGQQVALLSLGATRNIIKGGWNAADVKPCDRSRRR